MNKLTHNGLFRLDKELNPQPDLVASYDFDENSYTWTFKLHPGIKFHDGSDLTADDVVATLNYTKTMPDIATYTTSYDNVTKVDELTITLTTDGPSASLLYDLAHHGNYIIPKELIDQDADMSANPIGAGPYKFVSWDRGEKITFVAFEDYFDKERAPKIKNIIWRIIPEGSSRTIAIESGEVDYIIELDSTAVKTLDANENVTVMKIPSVSHNWLCINNEVPPFDNVNVRRAINCAINRADIIEVALNGAGVPATAQTPAGMLGENPDNFGGEYDVEKAKGELVGVIDSITSEMTVIFKEQFALIRESFQETFLELFGGGKATLELEDENDVLSCGIEIKVQPPGKALKTITLLSGGEKAFVAIALYFAILKVHPTPFCVMDEIEAALDEPNVVRVANYMRRITSKTQFIVITHRRGTMEAADVLYGVTMQERGVSKVLTINMNDMAKELNIKE